MKAEKIVGIENIDVLKCTKGKITVHVHLVYPNYDDLLHLSPKERMRLIRQKQRNRFKSFVSILPTKKYKRLGSHIAPLGVEIKMNAAQIEQVSENETVQTIFIHDNEEIYPPEEAVIEQYFAVVARFAIQIENRTKGLQRYEDRTLLVKAVNVEEAHQKLNKGFNSYGKPYINSYGELVRWKFEAFIESYMTGYESLDEMMEDDQEGIEIFSVLKKRKLKKERMWVRDIK